MALHCAPVAKLDKASVYETEDCWFESSRVRHFTRHSSAYGPPVAPHPSQRSLSRRRASGSSATPLAAGLMQRPP